LHTGSIEQPRKHNCHYELAPFFHSDPPFHVSHEVTV